MTSPPTPANAQVTQLLQRAASGDAHVTDDLLPLVYDELRRLAAAQLAAEQPGVTLQPTALVHEVYLRLVGDGEVRWNSRGHFFGAAARAMRRILVDRARHNQALKRGGADRQRIPIDDLSLIAEPAPSDMLAIDDALTRLEAYDPAKARLVMLRYFTGLTIDQTAAALDLTPAAVKAEWAYARAWMHRELEKSSDDRADGGPPLRGGSSAIGEPRS